MGTDGPRWGGGEWRMRQRLEAYVKTQADADAGISR